MGDVAPYLQMSGRGVGIGAALRESIKDDSVRSLAVELDLAARRPDDGRHPLPGRVELAHVEDLVLLVPAEHVDKDGPRLSRVEPVAEELCARDERGLVRTRSLVDDLSVVLDLGDNRVADGEQGDKLSNDVALPSLVLLQPSSKLLKGLLTTNVRSVRTSLTTLGILDSLGILDACDGALLELHLVASERSGLVREDVLDLAELFDERRGSAQCGRVGLSVVPIRKQRTSSVGQSRLDETD